MAGTRLLVIGGGSAGLGIAAKMARRLPKGSTTLLDPIQTHYYQPGFTLVGAGLMNLQQNRRLQKDLIPSGVNWIRERAIAVDPHKNAVTTEGGITLHYDYLVVCTGIEIRLDMIDGLADAMSDESCPVSTIYLPHYAEKTHRLLSTIESGNFLFSFPSTPIKCAGAPQKICYIADDILRSRGVRPSTSLHYYTTLPRIFGVEKYANELMKVVKDRDINLHTRHSLKSVDGKQRRATFENLDDSSQVEMEFSFLHVGPPCSAVSTLRASPSLTDSNGFVDVNPQTLQSTRFPNVFSLGDCANTPNAKTAAAISSQLKTVERNLSDAIQGKPLLSQYDGYASCPLLVSRSHVILAEFGPAGLPLESFPFDQSKPSRFSFLLKRYFMPWLYWNGLIKGLWNGPSSIRRLVAPFKRN